MKPHDVGGRPAQQPIVREQQAFMPWELRVDALAVLLSNVRQAGGRDLTISTDERRRVIESLSAAEYERLSYYSKWLRSLLVLLAEKGVIDRERVERRALELAAEHEREHGAP